MSSQVIPVNVQVPGLATAPVVADFVEHALRVAYVNRRDCKHLPDAEWAAPGVYVLLTDDGSGQVYVGQAVNLRQRLQQHHAKPRLDWRRAVAIKRDTSHGFNSAEIGYLEGRLSSEIAAIPGVVVVEGLKSQDNTLPPHLMLSLDALLVSMLAALRLAGVDTFKEADLPEGSANPRRRNGPTKTHTTISGTVADLLAAGLLRAGAELVLTQGGRTATASVSTSGEVVVAGVSYRSPSRAAATALGMQSSNGWTTWHVGSMAGPTLAQLRAQLPPTQDDADDATA
jgi:hypothetical protein